MYLFPCHIFGSIIFRLSTQIDNQYYPQLIAIIYTLQCTTFKCNPLASSYNGRQSNEPMCSFPTPICKHSHFGAYREGSKNAIGIDFLYTNFIKLTNNGDVVSISTFYSLNSVLEIEM
jgi:hypothetical protein